VPNTTFDDDEPKCRCGHVSWYHYAIIEDSDQAQGKAACCKMDCACMGWADPPKVKAPKKKIKAPVPVPA
jgi:hypothetical protein